MDLIQIATSTIQAEAQLCLYDVTWNLQQSLTRVTFFTNCTNLVSLVQDTSILHKLILGVLCNALKN